MSNPHLPRATTDYLTFFVIKADDAATCENILKNINVKNLFGLSENEIRPLAVAAYQETTQDTQLQDVEPKCSFFIAPSSVEVPCDIPFSPEH